MTSASRGCQHAPPPLAGSTTTKEDRSLVGKTDRSSGGICGYRCLDKTLETQRELMRGLETVRGPFRVVLEPLRRFRERALFKATVTGERALFCQSDLA